MVNFAVGSLIAIGCAFSIEWIIRYMLKTKQWVDDREPVF